MTATPTKEVTVDEILPLEVRVLTWTQNLCKALEANYQGQYPDSSSDKKFEIESGRKYHKIMMYDLSLDGERWSGGVHAFIDKKTGEVYKPASWRSPAKHVRYDLRIIKEREYVLNPANCGWAGGYLYMR